MDRYFSSKYFLFLLLAMVMSYAPAHAQIDTSLDCNITFPFTVDGTRLPAGEYVITAPDMNELSVLEFRSADNRISVELVTNSDQATTIPKISELLFDRIGKRDFLREIWVEGTTTGYRLPESHAEAKLVKQALKRESHRLTVKHVKK